MSLRKVPERHHSDIEGTDYKKISSFQDAIVRLLAILHKLCKKLYSFITKTLYSFVL